MKVSIVVTLLSFWATLGLSVPVKTSDQSRAERTIPSEELELELEEIENRVDAIKRKVKEETEKKQPVTGIFSATPSVETTVAINVKSDKITNKPQKIQFTKPSLEPTIQITRISPTPTVSKNTVVKVQVEKLQPEVVVKQREREENIKNEIKVEKLPPEKNEIKVEVLPSAQRKEVEENTKDTVSSVERVSESITKSKNVQPLTSESKDGVAGGKVKEKENKKETRLPIQILVEKKENDEELDLAVGSKKKSKNSKTVISVEKISQPEKNKEIKEKSPGHAVIVKVEKVANEEKVNGPHQITIKKVQNDEVGEQGKEREEDKQKAVEEEDLQVTMLKQDVLNVKETPEEQRIAQAFDKALLKERSKGVKLKTEVPKTHSPIIPTTIIQSAETKEAESENQRVTPASIEELELVALAEKTLNEDNENKKKALDSAQPPPTTVAKEENHSEVTVIVTKVTNKNFLSEKEIAKEEKKLSEELNKEMEQERTGPPPLIEIAKTTEKPVATTAEAAVKNEGPEINPEKEPEHDIEGEQEQQLEN